MAASPGEIIFWFKPQDIDSIDRYNFQIQLISSARTDKDLITVGEISNGGQFVHWFRHSSPYINAHRGRTFVIAFDGAAVAAGNFPELIHDISLLNSLGVRLVLVHGARPQIDARLEIAGIGSQQHQGRRITDDATLAEVKAAVGVVRMNIEAQLSMGLANSPMAGARIRVSSGNLVTARPLGIIGGIDFCHTGEVRRIDTEAIRRQLDDETIVLLSPVGYSPTGEIFNLRFEEVATATAIQLKADKLIFLTDNAELRNKQGQVVTHMTPRQADAYLRQENHSLLPMALRACRQGVRRAHLLDRRQPGALLLELFSRNGSGTLISADSYDTVRQANIEDVGGILELIEPLERDGILVRRSRERLEMEIGHFTVMERDGMIIACAALYPFPQEALGELACLAVHPDYQREGRGDQLLNLIESQASHQGLRRLFVLTSRTAHWFQERGFAPATLHDLPLQRQSLYNYQRRSKVFVKTLSPERPAC